MALKIVTVVVTKIDGLTVTPPVTRYLQGGRIDDMANIATGAAFKYLPLDASTTRNYETSTAASTIEAAANA